MRRDLGRWSELCLLRLPALAAACARCYRLLPALPGWLTEFNTELYIDN